MAKLKYFINQYIQGKNQLISLSDFGTLTYIYDAMKRREKPCFVQAGVKDVLNRCGIPTIEYGIGWKIK